jgi:hypothetical protein
MVADLPRCGLRERRVASGAPASLGACLAAGATVQQAEALGPLDLVHGEMGLASGTHALAGRIVPRERVSVGSWHGVLLQNSG